MQTINSILERLRNEPVVLFVLAGIVVALGLDLTALSEEVERILQIIALLGASGLARRQVTPTRKLDQQEPSDVP